MIARCTNSNHKSYKTYGDRGIAVDPKWLGRQGFQKFLTDMGERPSKEYELNRIDPNSNYGPGLCEWAMKGVGRRRSDSIVRCQGVKMRLGEACIAAGGVVSPECARQRIKRGWGVTKAVETPIGV
jgi:hypothetical protein